MNVYGNKSKKIGEICTSDMIITTDVFRLTNYIIKIYIGTYI